MRRRTRTLPLRWRLTIWYVSLLAVIVVFFSASVTIGLRYFLHRSLDNTLENQAALLTESIDIENGEPSIGDRRIRNRPGQQFVRLVDRDGELLTDSNPAADDVRLNDPGFERAMNGLPDFRWRTVQDERMRVLSQPVVIDDRVVAVVQVGLAGRSVESIFSQTLLLILAVGSGALVLAVVGGVLLADRALRPIDRMTRLAARISDQDLSRRIELPASDDELGRLATTFNEMLDRLEHALTRQRQFTAAASHELRTPLAMMQGQIELAMSNDLIRVDDQQVLASLHTDVIRLTRISNTLLMLARSDAGELYLTLERVDLRGLLELIVEQYAPLAESSGIDTEVISVRAPVFADEDRLVQLLVNLVDNAFQHTPDGRRITLGCSVNGAHATIIVQDEGNGITPFDLPHVFERFYRAHGIRQDSHGGAGLGLAISKMIVDAHEGEITIDSQPGLGTRVTVTLPINGPGSNR